MRESNFSNPVQNKACICISAAVYDRRAIDCTATLPLINSLNHLAYLTSTSPRIREMVCVDGGLERLIRILRQVPRTPPQPAMRGVITKEMQAIWKWSLAFQCVVNIGVRGSENIRTRVVEAGMVPVAVRVLESYLRIADAIREEKKREARKEEQRLRNERGTEALRGIPDVTTPTASNLRRGAISHSDSQNQGEVMALQPSASGSRHLAHSGGSRQRESDARSGSGDSSGSNPSVMESYMAASASTSNIRQSHDQQVASLSAAPVMETMTPLVAALEAQSGMSASSSSSSIIVHGSENGAVENGSGAVATYPSGLITNASSVEDFTASASGSDGAEDADMEGEESDSNNQVNSLRSREGSNIDMEETFETGEGATPRPLRRILAPIVTTANDQTLRRETPTVWQANSGAPASVTPTRETTILATPRRPHVESIADSRGRLPPPMPTTREQGRTAVTPANVNDQIATATARPHHHHHHHHHHHSHRERGNGETTLHPSDMIYREEEVLLSLQLLAYLSKYAHVRSLFHCDLASLNSIDTLEGALNSGIREGQSWNPMQPSKKNVFCIAERYTLRSSRTGLCHFAAHGETRVAPEIQYWAGVIMRNACRKDENHGGIRQCANMLCGKWEKQPREFAKCRRCRKAKYCSKQCQSKGWQMGHRFWCSARSDDEHGEGKEKSKEKVTASEIVEIGRTDGEEELPEDGLRERRDGQPLLHNLMNGGEGLMPMTMQQQQQQIQAPIGHTHVSPEALVLNNQRPSRVSALAERRHASSALHGQPSLHPSSASASGDRGGRRAVSAIPAHLQAPSSDDLHGNGFRSRTVSAASSGAELSDMSDDEMERANRRVLASTVSPAQRSPGLALTPLANMTTAEDAMLAGAISPGIMNENMMGDFDVTTTRTDLAGRPLPPPVIAQHDPAIGQQAVGDELLTLGGRLTPGVQEEQDNAVFGRGDIDQMIWRGRTPAPDDQEEIEGQRRRGDTITARVGNRSRLVETEDEEEEDGDTTSTRHQQGGSTIDDTPPTSLLNSALLLAGGSSSSSSHSRTMAASSPRFAPSSLHALHAPVARQTHRFASIAATSSPIASSSGSTMPPHNFVRGSLANTFGDWRGGGDDHMTSASPDMMQNSGLGLNDNHHHRHNIATQSTSSLIHDHSGRVSLAPNYTHAMGTNAEMSTSNDFIIPSDIQDLLNSVEGHDEMLIDSM